MATTTKLVELFNADETIAALSTQAFVEAAYENLLGLSGDFSNKDARVAYWVAKIDAGLATTDFAATFLAAAAVQGDLLTDAEFAANTAALAAVAALDETGLTLEAVKAAAVASAEPEVEEPSNPGETFTLTTAATDVIEGTAGDDTITGDTTTLQTTDVISDASSDDNDTLNLTFTGANATTASITGIENINVELDYFTGTGNDIDLTNTKAATVTIGSSKLGFNGTAGASKVGDNTVVAGDNVKVLTATGVTTGAVDAGSAGTVNVTGLAGVATSVTVNGDIKTGTGLTFTTADTATLDFTADAAVTLDTAASAKTTLTGSGNVVLTMAAADVATTETLTNSMEEGSTVTVKTGGNIDATKFSGVDKIIVDGTTSQAVVVASDQVLETSADIGTDLTVTTTATTATTATVNLGHDVNLLDLKDDKLVTTIVNNDVNAITTLTATGEKVILQGASNLTAGGVDAKTLDASAFTGDLAITMAAGVTELTMSGGAGKNTVTAGNVGDTLSLTGQAGVDTINVLDDYAGTIAGDLGAGNDVVNFQDAAGSVLTGAANIAIVGGAGTDTLKFVTAANTTGVAGWVANGFEVIEVSGGTALAVDTLALTMDSSQLSGIAYDVNTKEGIDTLGLVVTMDKATADLSTLTMDAGDTVAVNGSATTSYTVTGTAVADTFTLGSNKAGEASSITTGAGKDVVVLATGDTAASNMLKITDFDLSATGDKLTTGVTTIVGDYAAAKDVKAKAEDGAFLSTDAAAIFADATGTVQVSVKNGIMTVSGLSADLALADTLAEWITLAQYAATNEDSSVAAAADTVAFVFGGNTYVVETGAETVTEAGGVGTVHDTSITLGAVNNVIELTGVTATAMAGTQAADTLFLA